MKGTSVPYARARAERVRAIVEDLDALIRPASTEQGVEPAPLVAAAGAEGMVPKAALKPALAAKVPEV